MSPIEEVRESLREFRDAIRDLTESRARRSYLSARIPRRFRVYGTGRRNDGIAPSFFRENAAPKLNHAKGATMAEIIDGKAVGEEVVATVKALTAELLERAASSPGWRWSSSARIRRARSTSPPNRARPRSAAFIRCSTRCRPTPAEAELLRIIARTQRRSRDQRHPGAAAACRRTSIPAASSRPSRRKRTSTASISSMSASSAPANWRRPSCRARRPARCC